MRCARLALLLIAFVGLGGCSILNDFGGYTFSDGGPVSKDAQPSDATTTADSGPADAGAGDGSTTIFNDDAGSDAGSDAGFVPADPRVPTSVSQTNGGAELVSANYRMSVAVGAPQPMITVQGTNYRLILGPVGTP